MSPTVKSVRGTLREHQRRAQQQRERDQSDAQPAATPRVALRARERSSCVIGDSAEQPRDVVVERDTHQQRPAARCRPAGRPPGRARTAGCPSATRPAGRRSARRRGSGSAAGSGSRATGEISTRKPRNGGRPASRRVTGVLGDVDRAAQVLERHLARAPCARTAAPAAPSCSRPRSAACSSAPPADSARCVRSDCGQVFGSVGGSMWMRPMRRPRTSSVATSTRVLASTPPRL